MNIVFDYPDEELRPAAEISIDLDRVADFLKEQGVKEKDIKRLCIRFAHRFTGQHRDKDPDSFLGVCDSRNGVISIFTYRHLSDQALNNTLLHELRHYMKKGYASQEEWNLPHNERPSEIDAYQFATAYNTTHRFMAVKYPPQDDSVLAISVLAAALSMLFISVHDLISQWNSVGGIQ